jgi:hypothetical protein
LKTFFVAVKSVNKVAIEERHAHPPEGLNQSLPYRHWCVGSLEQTNIERNKDQQHASKDEG